MSLISKLRAGALSLVLAAAPVTGFAQSTYFPPTAQLLQTAEALFEAALLRPAPRSATPAFDAASLASLSGEAVSLTAAASSHDPATGAWQLSDISVNLPAGRPKPLMTADSALVWGLDAAALAARFRGERLDETLRIFERIELSGVVLDLTDFSNKVDVLAAELSPDASRTYYEDATMDVSRLVLGGLTLHPWTHRAAEGEEAGLGAIRLISAIARSFSLDTVLFEDAVSSQYVETDMVAGNMVYSYPRSLLSGYDRGRLGGGYQTGFSFNFDYDAEGLAPEAAELASFQMSGRGSYGSWTGFDLSPLLKWGELGQLPPVSERNLWSFGKYVLDDLELDLNGHPLFSVARMEMTADEFAWLLPERISLGYQGMTLDIGGFLSFAGEISGESSAAGAAPPVAEILAMMERAGLARLTGDGMLDILWNSETGQSRIESRGRTEGLFAGLTRIDFDLPSYAALIPAFGPDEVTPDEAALASLVEKTTALRGAELTISDIGGLNAIASLVIELARSGYVDDPGLSAFADQTPEGLRMFASAMTSLSAASIAAELPQARPWIGAAAQFIANGGSFSIRLNPAKPVRAQHLDGDATEFPSGVIGLLGLSITHTPPVK